MEVMYFSLVLEVKGGMLFIIEILTSVTKWKLYVFALR